MYNIDGHAVKSSQNHSIAVLAGDGIGAEVTDQALRLFDAIKQTHGVSLNVTHIPCGAKYYAEHGVVVADNILELLSPFDAIYLGALGWPATMPDHVAIAPIIRIRQAFCQYACVRPAKSRPGVSSPLRNSVSIDMLIVRENSEGEYVSCGGQFHPDQVDHLAVQTAIHTRSGIERILRFGFQQAQMRRQHLTLITKSNALTHSMVLWDQVFDAIRKQFPHIHSDKLHVDAAAMNFVLHPDRYDVVVASNLFGDILTDLSGAIIGGLGLCPSANLNPERKFPSMFEPVHGSAPDIAGQGIANPIGAILSGAMMLDWLGAHDSAKAIESAVDRTLAEGSKTRDLGGELTTEHVTDRVIQHLYQASK